MRARLERREIHIKTRPHQEQDQEQDPSEANSESSEVDREPASEVNLPGDTVQYHLLRDFRDVDSRGNFLARREEGAGGE